jgi:hypothetical protein
VGLHKVISHTAWHKFGEFVDPGEFTTMVVGHGIDIEDWKKHTSYEGFKYREISTSSTSGSSSSSSSSGSGGSGSTNTNSGNASSNPTGSENGNPTGSATGATSNSGSNSNGPSGASSSSSGPNGGNGPKPKSKIDPEKTSPVVRWFWEIVEELCEQEREDLWTFISGSKGVRKRR